MKIFINLIVFAFIFVFETESYRGGSNYGEEYIEDYDKHYPRDDYFFEKYRTFEKPGYRKSVPRSEFRESVTNYAAAEPKAEKRDAKEQPICLTNEEYKKCGDECGKHCRDITNIPPGIKCISLPCDKYSDGCFCKQGFYRKDTTGECVTKKECKTIGPSARKAETKPIKAKNAKKKPKSGGKTKSKDNEKSKASRKGKKLPKKSSRSFSSIMCGKNEIYSSCGSDCGQTCDYLKRGFPMCPTLCKDGCFCIDGTFRDSDRNCISQDQCD